MQQKLQVLSVALSSKEVVPVNGHNVKFV